MKKIIIEEPINNIINKIDDSSKESILLVGRKGTGKSTVLSNYMKLNDYYTINCTLNEEDMLPIKDNDIYKLYHICLLINKILDFINDYYPICINYFNEFQVNIKIILFNIKNMFMIDNYQKKYELFGMDICNNPELLLDELINKLKIHLDYNSLELIFDNFDVLGNSSSKYQNYIYNLLKGKIRTIYSVSDVNGIDDKKNILLRNNDIIDVNYSYDVNYVKRILDSMILLNVYQNSRAKIVNRLSSVLDDELIELLISITNGNINEMYNIVFHLYKYKDQIDKESYKDFIIDYYNERLLLLEEYFSNISKRKLSI